MQIIKMENIHTDQVLILEKENFSDFYTKQMLLDMNENYYNIVAFDTEVLGYMSINHILDESDIMRIVVSKNHRKKGIAKKLLQNTFEFCKKNDIKKIHLEVRESNINAILLYEKMGFINIAIRKNYYKNENGIIMTKEVE